MLPTAYWARKILFTLGQTGQKCQCLAALKGD